MERFRRLCIDGEWKRAMNEFDLLPDHLKGKALSDYCSPHCLPIHYLVRVCDSQTIFKIARYDETSIDFPDINRKVPLMIAVLRGDVEVIRALLDVGASWRLTPHSIFHVAASTGRCNVMKLLIRHAGIESLYVEPNNKYTGLFRDIVARHDVDMVDTILRTSKKHSSLLIYTIVARRIMFHSIILQEEVIVERVISEGNVDPSVRVTDTLDDNIYRQTPLEEAILTKNMSIILRLLHNSSSYDGVAAYTTIHSRDVSIVKLVLGVVKTVGARDISKVIKGSIPIWMLYDIIELFVSVYVEGCGKKEKWSLHGYLLSSMVPRFVDSSEHNRIVRAVYDRVSELIRASMIDRLEGLSCRKCVDLPSLRQITLHRLRMIHVRQSLTPKVP